MTAPAPLLAALAATLLPTSLQDLSAGRVLVLEALDGSQERLPLEGLGEVDPARSGAVFARYEGLEPPREAGPAGARCELALHGGDRLVGWIRGGDEEGLRFAPAAGVELELSIESLAALIVPGRLPADGSARPAAPEEGDRLYVRRGRGVDQLDGVLLGFSDAGVLFEGRLGERTHPWEEVAALFVEDLGGDAAEPPVDPIAVEVAGGGRLGGALERLDAGGVTLRRGAGTVRLPAELVVEVARLDGSYRFLSELPPADTGPLTLFGTGDDLGMVYPPRIDRNCLGGPLRSAGRSWSRGIGVHAPSRLTWKLGGAWKRLRGRAAIDDSALANRHAGSVVFRVLADGEVAWESALARGGDPPQEFSVDLAGVDELVLEVDPASEAFVSDRANWLRPILIGSE